MHSKTWIHSDIKPANIMLNERYEAIIVDFGNMVQIGSKHRGSAWYHDNETEEEASPLSDLYSLSVIILQLVMKRRNPDNLMAEAVNCLKKRYLVHPDLGKDSKSTRVGARLISLAVDCSQPELSKRPVSVRPFLERFDDIVTLIGLEREGE
ncbi:hypothetical protein C3L33_18178, partial [Rhododendron williamsianum]